MIKVTVGNNLNRTAVIADPSTKIRKVLEDNNIAYENGGTHLDGVSLKAGDFDKSFADFGITDKCYLLNVVKADAAR